MNQMLQANSIIQSLPSSPTLASIALIEILKKEGKKVFNFGVGEMNSPGNVIIPFLLRLK